MKKVKPNLKKMFNFHTIILVLIFIVVSTLNSNTVEAKLQTNHKHHSHQHHNDHQQQHNVVGGGGGGEDVEKDTKVSVNDKQQHHKHHHHQHSHLHNHDHNVTPSIEFTTSSSAAVSTSSSSSSSINSDNEFSIKQEQQQEQPPPTNKDEIYYKTKDFKTFSSSSSSSSTTSKPSSLSIQLIKKSNLQNSSQFFTKSNSQREHTHHHNNQQHQQQHHIENYQRLKQAAILTKHQGGNFPNNDDDTQQVTMYSDDTNEESKNSKWNLATKHEKVSTKLNEHHYYDRENLKPEFDNDRRLKAEHQNYEDYYSDAEDETDDDDEDDEYNDGISYDDDKNLSDRSYARITRSKLDIDYADDEPYRNELQNDAPGVLTDRKYSEVGNEKAVQQARERYLQEQKRPRTPHELATEHWQRMIQATKCRKPMPRVIPVSNNTSKRYEPYATILHRCGDDTGCCGSTASVCTVKRQEIVMIYVFSYDFNYRKEIEALPMQNHTECHCVNRASLLHDYMPRGKRSGGSGRLAAAVVGGLGSGSSRGNNNYLQHFQRLQNKREHDLHQQQYQQEQYQQSFQHHEQQLQNMLDCHCPRHFNVFEEDVERHAHLPKPHSVFIRKCRCDCLVNNQTCLRFKHGEEGFSLEDRKCILDRNCKPPVCSYGEYNLRVGRCPSSRPHLPQMT